MSNKIAYWTIYCGPVNGNGYIVNPKPSQIYDCYFFSNNSTILEIAKQNNFITVFLECDIENDHYKDSLNCRIYKIQSHKLPELHKYEYNCYYDTKRLIDVSIVERFITSNDQKVMAIRKHPCQYNVFEDFTACMLQERYSVDTVKYAKMICNNLTKEMRVSNEHIESCVIIRKKCDLSTKINMRWWELCQTYCGVHDQISCGIVFHEFRKYTELLDKKVSKTN